MENKSNKRQLGTQISRFIIVGGTAFLLDYGILFVLTEYAEFNYLLSNAIGFSVSVIYNYVLSILWVFNSKYAVLEVKSFTVFILLSVLGLFINQLVMWIGTSLLGFYYLLTKIFATAIVMVYNFITRKIFLE